MLGLRWKGGVGGREARSYDAGRQQLTSESPTLPSPSEGGEVQGAGRVEKPRSSGLDEVELAADLSESGKRLIQIGSGVAG